MNVTSSHVHAVRGEVLNRLKETVAEIRSRDRSWSRLKCL